MVAQENHLRSFGQFAKRLESGACSRVVVVNEEIVCDKRQRRSMIEMHFQRGQPKCQKELVPGSIAHARYTDQRSVAALAFQDHWLLVKINDQAIEGAQCQFRKNGARLRQQRPLLFLPISINGPAQQSCCRKHLHVTLGHI